MIETPLKWVGGKSRIKDFIINNFPNKFTNYYEPFLGSGTIFLTLKQREETSRLWFLSDVNSHLICWWQSIQNNISKLLGNLLEIKERYQRGDCKENYYLLRDEFNKYDKLDTYKSALFMFLSRTAFNGLVRYNSKGEFNAAWGNQTSGRHKNNFIVEENYLLELHKVIQGEVHFNCCSYLDSCPKKDDFVFCDPPYIAIDKRKIDKLAYSKDGFALNEQIEFSNWAKTKVTDGVQVMICNHDTDFIRNTFSEFEFISYSLMKSFSGNIASRKNTPEILMYKY